MSAYKDPNDSLERVVYVLEFFSVGDRVDAELDSDLEKLSDCGKTYIEKLAPLGIINALLMTPLKPLNIIML